MALSNALDVIVVGGGAAGISVTASLLKRKPNLRIAIIEPSKQHYYQPAWTLVGGGAYDIGQTMRPTASLIPPGVQWLRASAATFEPEHNQLSLTNGRTLKYAQLIVCPGLQLAWNQIEGLEATLGKYGVTSNYCFDLAPYTWQLVRTTWRGTALFTQPALPIKCAGAPQKAMYLACDHWLRASVLHNINVEFNLAGDALFGVQAFVPTLMQYVERYHSTLTYRSNLIAVDGPNQIASFAVKDGDGHITRIDKPFNMLHVVPPQIAPECVRTSPLANADGWCEVDHQTLQHPRYPHVFALGDVCSAPNAKTAAAAREQAVIVARNLLAARDNAPLPARYDGYGACPLTVEKGRVVLAEFGYGGKLLPTFPLSPTVPRRTAWYLKTVVLPWLYWNGMLKGREWFTRAS